MSASRPQAEGCAEMRDGSLIFPGTENRVGRE